MPAPAHSDVASSISVFAQTQSVSRTQVASVAILTYDILITLGDEVEFIWSRRWTVAKVMYVFARYIPWLFQLALLAISIDGTTGLFFTLSECRKWIVVQAVILQLIVSIVDIIMMTRVYALYCPSKSLLVAFVILLCGETGYTSYVLGYVTPKLTFNEDCFVTSSPPLFITYWIVSLAVETVLFLLQLGKFIPAACQGLGFRPVMKQFMADGTWAYALIFAVMFLNSMLYKFVHSPLAGICFTWLLSSLSFTGSRLLLNPRKHSYRVEALETIEFEEISLHYPNSPTGKIDFEDIELYIPSRK